MQDASLSITIASGSAWAPGNLHREPFDVNVFGRQRVPAVLWNQPPMGALAVVAILELRRAYPGIVRMLIQTPLHLFLLQRAVESFQQTQLRRRAIGDPHMGQLVLHETGELPRSCFFITR